MAETGSFAEGMAPRELPEAWKNSDIDQMIMRQKTKGWTPTMLVSDFDNSYFKPDDNENTNKLASVARNHDVPICIVTGNSAQGLIDKILENNLQEPQVVIGAVGTEVYVLHTNPDGSKKYVQDDEFAKLLSDKHFDRKGTVNQIQQTIEEWQHEASPDHTWEMDFQNPAVEQAFRENTETPVQPYKVSMYAYATDDTRGQLEQKVRSKFPNVEIAVCEEINYNKAHMGEAKKKFCIDMLPIIPKADAVNHVTDLLGIKRGFVVGDSGNDIPLFTKTKAIREGVIVGGAKPELPHQVLPNERAIGNTGFTRVLEGSGRSGKPTARKVFVEHGPRVAAGSIIEATIRRLEVMKRFEQNTEVRTDINGMIAELQE